MSVLELVAAVILAFVGFMLRMLDRRVSKTLEISQLNQVALGVLHEKIDSLGERMSRIERTSDDAGTVRQ